MYVSVQSKSSFSPLHGAVHGLAERPFHSMLMASIELADLQPEDDAAMASRLTCKEYVALVVMQVVENMDAIAWARVERPIRGAELAQTLENAEEHVVGGARPSQFPAHSVATGVLNAVQLVLGIDCRPMTEKRSNHHYTDLCDHYPVVRQFALHSRGFGAWEWKATLSDPASIDAWFATAPAIWTSLSALHKKREIRGYCLHTSPADSWVPTPGQTIRFVGLRFESLNGGSGALMKFYSLPAAMGGALPDSRWCFCSGPVQNHKPHAC